MCWSDGLANTGTPLRAELPERRRRVGIGFDLRAAELAGRRAKLARAGPRRKDEQNGLEEVKREQRALVLEKDRAPRPYRDCARSDRRRRRPLSRPCPRCARE